MTKDLSNFASDAKARPTSLAQAVSLHLDGKLEQALEEINRALENQPASLELFSAKAQIQFELEQYEEAAKSYARVLSMNPRHAHANLNIAVCLERLGRWQESVEFFEKAVEAEPDRLEALLGLAVALLHVDKIDAAGERFGQVLSAEADHPTALFGKAVTLQLQGRSDEAARIYESLLKRNSNAEECLANLITIGLAGQDYGRVS
ncbi:MAG TPA: tetratricopeptide repeat protein, partial [Candidatus Sulfopaludibacter sp.]|nr:tetratricopeptide repeat protein [Candidatus Sulfopaludibacter sp.]